MNRRRVLRGLGAAVVTAGAGCSVLDDGGTVVDDERTVDLADTELSAPEFLAAAEDTHGAHGPGGVWGRGGTEPEHDLGFQGAWSSTLDHDDVRSRHLLALFRLPNGPDGADASQVWLWSGVDPRGGTVQRVETGVTVPETSWVGTYSPARDVSADRTDRYAVESGRLDAATLGATMPLAGGSIGVEPDTRIGEGGAYRPYWEGDGTAARSLAATTELRWADAADRELTWSVAVESGA